LTAQQTKIEIEIKIKQINTQMEIYSYKALGKIVINSFLLMFITFSALLSSDYTLTVLDKSNSKPLIGATVHFISLSGKTKSTIVVHKTNKKGLVSIPFEGKVGVSVRYMGYKGFADTLEITKNLVVSLEPTSIMLQEIVTTGQFSPQSVQNSIYPVEVISEERIASQAASNLRDLLQTQLNMRISQDNILGSSISINGLSGQNVKIMVDGVPIIGRMNGNIDISQINMNNIQKVEIIEGPMSTIYGTDALGGVINLITKDADNCKRLEFTGDTYYESVGIANFDGSLKFNLLGNNNIVLSGSRNFFGGYSVVDTSRNKEWKPKIQYTADLKYGTKLGDFNFNYSTRYFDEYILNRGVPRPPYYEDAFDDEYKTYRLSNSVFFNGYLSEYNYLNLMADYSFYRREKNTYFKDLTTLHQVITSNPDDQDTTKFYSWLFRGSYSWDNPYNLFSLLTGTEINYETAFGKRIENDSKTQGDYAAYASVNYRPFEELQIQPSLRFIYNTQYQAPIVPAINFKYQPWNNLNFRASYAKGFRAPSLEELYYIFVDVNHNIYGNPDLKAETSNSYNASVDYRMQIDNSVLNLTLNGFYNNVTNLVTFALISGDKYSYINVGKYKTQGAELSANFISENLNAQFGYSYIGRYNEYSETSNTPQYTYSPEIQANILYKMPCLPELQLNAFYKYTGKLPGYGIGEDNSIVQYIISDYQMLDLSLGLNLYNNAVNFQLGVKNLFDVKQIEQSVPTIGGAHSSGSAEMPVAWGRTLFLSLQFNLDKLLNY
jgi:outer membrane receptor for ferrienterochelin and colicins